LNKKGNAFIYIIILLIVLLIASTQKIEVNEKQAKVATPTSCGLIGRNYDPIVHICVGDIKNDSQNAQG